MRSPSNGHFVTETPCLAFELWIQSGPSSGNGPRRPSKRHLHRLAEVGRNRKGGLSIPATITRSEARRLALARAGLLKPEWTDIPNRSSGARQRDVKSCHTIIRRFGYLQIDTLSGTGARSHGIVLLSRLDGLDPEIPEQLLRPGEPLFEFWGHEACWLPIELYPTFSFRRKDFRIHPWYGDVLGEHGKLAQQMVRRIRKEGPLRLSDFDSSARFGPLKLAHVVLGALWLRGDIAIRERVGFQRSFDITERVIPAQWRKKAVPKEKALQFLLLKALEGHGWAQTATLRETWRLSKLQKEIRAALGRLEEAGQIVSCELIKPQSDPVPGWIRPDDLELAVRLKRIRPRTDQGVFLSPFDPVLWDRERVRLLFDFDQVLEVFKPAKKRIYGYYCLPVLAGDRLVARCDLKADRRAGRLNILSTHYERKGSAADRQATRIALERYGQALDLQPTRA